MAYNIAVIGADGLVGREILTLLAERAFPVGQIYAVAAGKASGGQVSFGDDDIKLYPIEEIDFKTIDLSFFAGPSALSETYARRAAATGKVIEMSGHFRGQADVPLIAVDINAEKLVQMGRSNQIVATPCSAALQVATALVPLHTQAGIKRVVISTYQAVSELGKDAMDELFNQTRQIFMNNTPETNALPKRIAFNVIPQVGEFMDDRATVDEWGMAVELKQLLVPSVGVVAHMVFVPVFIGHGHMVNVECDSDMDALAARALWMKSPGITLIDLETDLGYVTPADIQGEDSTFISRTRDDTSAPDAISFWCTGDNIRKGAALNAVQIAERWLKQSS